jgi:hypothetical protein
VGKDALHPSQASCLTSRRLSELPIFFRKPCFSGEDLEALELARENTIKGAIFLAFLISLSFWERVVIRCS